MEIIPGVNGFEIGPSRKSSEGLLNTVYNFETSSANIDVTSTSIKKDQLGRENMKMRFYVSGPRNDGIVTAHLVKDLETKEYGYELLVLDVKGLSRGKEAFSS